MITLGIDLGSTTSKAVLLDEQEQVIGRGITNTRANYDVAVEVSRREAMMDARLSLLVPTLGEYAASVRSAFHVTQDLHHLHMLRETCRAVASIVPGDGVRLVPTVDALILRMVDEAATLFGSSTRARGVFFRDVVGARFFALAEETCARSDQDFDRLVGIYDKAILQVENEVSDVDFSEILDRALRDVKLPQFLFDETRRAATEIAKKQLNIAALVGTGYGRQRLPFPKECIRSEILCHGLGAHVLFPQTRTVLDIGGQDTKAIQVDARGWVTAFQMNDRCAAGCGRYLGYIADELNIGLHELGALALQAQRPCRITSTCTVFAGIELRDLLSVGERREDILGGLHRAIVTRAMSLLARSGGVYDELTFTGGVARNAACVAALRELVTRHYGQRTINIHPESIYTGALGAALFAKQMTEGKADLVPDDIDDARECEGCSD